MRAGVAYCAIGLDYVRLSADIALGCHGQGLVLPVLNLPLDDVVAALAEVVKGRVLDLFGLDRVLVVVKLESILVLLPTLLCVALLE